MPPKHFSLNIGLSDYAITAYMTLLNTNPLNGSQISRLAAKGYIVRADNPTLMPGNLLCIEIFMQAET